MIEIQIINIISLFWKQNTFLAVYCTLSTLIQVYIKKETAKQISKQNKTKKKTNGKWDVEGLQQDSNLVPPG